MKPVVGCSVALRRGRQTRPPQISFSPLKEDEMQGRNWKLALLLAATVGAMSGAAIAQTAAPSMRDTDNARQQPQGLRDTDAARQQPQGLRDTDAARQQPQGLRDADVARQEPKGLKDADEARQEPKGLRDGETARPAK